MKLRKKDLRKLAEFLLNAQQGERMIVKGFILVKDFKLEDVGFTYINGKYYTYDPNIGIGRRVSKEYIIEILEDSLKVHPEVFFEDLNIS